MSSISFDSDGLTLNDPEQMELIKGLSNPLDISLLQIMNSKIDDRLFNSWWSTGALRQLTYINRTSTVDRKMKHFVKLGLVDVLKIRNLPSYSITKKYAHGLIDIPTGNKFRKKYTGDGLCYKLSSEFIELVLRKKGIRCLFLPLENMNAENLKLIKIRLKRRTMIILNAFSGDLSDLYINDFTQHLNGYYNRIEKGKSMDKIYNYDFSSLYKLAKQYFRDNLTNKIYSNSFKDNKLIDKWFIINRKASRINQSRGRTYNSMLYSLNFDRVRFLLSNQIGERLRDNNRSIHYHYPEATQINEGIITSESIEAEDVFHHGIVVDIQ